MKLTDSACKKAKIHSKTQKLFDGAGLYLEITPQGGKLWRLKYRYAGKEKRIALGAYPLISLKQAREKRDEAKKMLDKLVDPALVRHETKYTTRTDNENTFEIIAREWHDTIKERWTEDYSACILRRMERDMFPKIGNIPIRNISPLILLNALRQIESKGIYETAKRARQYCSQVLRYGVATGRCERDVSVDITGALKRGKVRHYAALDVQELPELFHKLAKNDARLFPATRLAVELLLLTFVRTSELLEATWKEFNIQDKVWIIPAERVKMRKAHIVPLSTQVLNILAELKRTQQ